MTETISVATQWLQGLAARGIAVNINRGRLRMSPASGYKTLSDEELLTLRHHRDAIKAVLAAGTTFEVVRAPMPSAQAPQAPTPDPCAFCHRAPCIGREHFAFALLHHDDPVEVEQRRQDATAEMMTCVGNPYRMSDWL